MELAHQTMLTDLLREVFETGAVRVEARILKRWYGISRFTNKIWDDLGARFREIDATCTPNGFRLGYWTWGEEGVITFVCLDPVGTEPAEVGFQPIENRKTERA